MCGQKLYLSTNCFVVKELEQFAATVGWVLESDDSCLLWQECYEAR